MLAQAFHIGHQMRGGVGDQPALGQAAPRAALVKEHGAKTAGVKKVGMAGLKAAAGSAMQKHRRNAAGVALDLDPQAVAVGDLKVKSRLGQRQFGVQRVSLSNTPPEKLRYRKRSCSSAASVAALAKISACSGDL